MAPLQVIILLVLIRLPAILANSPQGWPGLVGRTGLSPAMQVLLVLSYVLTHVALVVFVWQKTRRAVRLLNLPSTDASEISHGIDHVMTWARWGTVAVVGTYLFVLPMSAVVTGWLGQTVFFSKLPMLAEVLYFIFPFGAWLAFWTANYEVESVIRERSFPYRLAQGLPAHPMPPLTMYLSMQIRHNFYLLVLIGIASFVEWLGDTLQGRISYAPAVATAVAFLAVMLMVPWLITRIWTTVPLRGPLRNRLDAMAKQYHIRFRNILIWKTHNQVTNAAILGPVRFARYFLMTDALLEQLTDQQIEAVFSENERSDTGCATRQHPLVPGRDDRGDVPGVGRVGDCAGVCSAGGECVRGGAPRGIRCRAAYPLDAADGFISDDWLFVCLAPV